MEPILTTIRQAEGIMHLTEICRKEEARANKLARRLDNKEITISVIGQFKRGKSSLVNSLIGEKLMPVGIIPITSAVTRIQYGNRNTTVHFENGVIEEIAKEDLPLYVSEQKNPDNERGVSMVTLYNESSFIRKGLTFVDTPGVGSIHKHNSEAAYSFVKESDGVIFLLSVDSPINEIEMEFLRRTRQYAGKFYFVVNKVDMVDSDELDSFVYYCQDLLANLMERDKVEIYPVSAKTGQGIDQLRNIFLDDCNENSMEILEESARMKLIDIIKSALVQLDLYWSSMVMPVGRLEVRINKMRAAISEIVSQAMKEMNVLKVEGSDKPTFHLEVLLNGVKEQLSAKVSELFAMEYHYEMKEVDKEKLAHIKENGQGFHFEKFQVELDSIVLDLKDTLGRILLYREENSITVAFKIDEFNKIRRKLRAILGLIQQGN
ncbi:MAG: dynamin family protein [Anaerovoracaceae bacterium]